MPNIILKDLTFSYHHQPIFEHLSMTFPANRWSSILGPSGTGKSSLLRLIAGLQTGGTLNAKAQIITEDSTPLSTLVTYLSQHDNLMPWLSTLENTVLGYKLRNQYTQSIKEEAIQLLSDLGLQTALHKRPPALSGGMRQRVMLARTLLEKKPIILLDEPFSALDAITRLKLQNLAATLLKDKTVILVTHDPLEALRLSHQIVILAGSPAHFRHHMHLEHATPRDLNDPALLKQQGDLLQELEAAQ